ncbi:FMN-binding protein [Siccirubricoccus sp. G192]|uniref:FMN-binding protein n=1 Tax=Siccirubricoccus sp. G192 TaxID=2849651 RepID=UPI001C2CA138|nr:FMN-binding protein [Siccirubricoccus sp. G192]MBV1797952.1 FMN-binding protein [Siccirubricoccus sp. G192]
MLLLVLAGGAGAPGDAVLRQVFPAADRFGAPEDTPPAMPAYDGDRLLGYVLSTKEVTGGGGYGTRPLDVLVGLGLDCRITGAELLEQHEPILMLGLGPGALAGFVRQYAGLDVARRIRIGAAAEGQSVQAISRATISSFALHDAILGAARAVARGRGLPCALGGGGGTARIELDAFQPEGWEALREDGSIARLRITAAEAAAALRRAGAPNPAAALLPPAANYATLYTALATPAQIGANLLGQAEHARLLADAAPGSNLVFIGGEGAYSFKGTAWVRSGVFDRVQIVQGERTIGLVAAQHHQVERLRAAGAPELREAAIFVLSPESGLDPAAPWRLELAITERRPEGGPAMAIFALPYTLPERHFRPAPPAEAMPEESEGGHAVMAPRLGGAIRAAYRPCPGAAGALRHADAAGPGVAAAALVAGAPLRGAGLHPGLARLACGGRSSRSSISFPSPRRCAWISAGSPSCSTRWASCSGASLPWRCCSGGAACSAAGSAPSARCRNC